MSSLIVVFLVFGGGAGGRGGFRRIRSDWNLSDCYLKWIFVEIMITFHGLFSPGGPVDLCRILEC